MKVLVAGGAGLMGSAITRAALNADHDVTILSRSRPDPLPDARAGWTAGDVTDPASLGPVLEGFEVVVDAVQIPNSPIENPAKGYTFERVDLGGTRNLVDAAVANGVSHFIGISGVGASEHGAYHWLRYKWREEEHIKNSGMPFTIFRGSWAFGPDDVALNRFLGFSNFLPFVPVIGDGKTRINPLFVDDLGSHVAAAISNPAARGKTFEIGGPDVLTMDEIIKTALKVSGRNRFLLHQPVGLMKAVASLIQHFPGRLLTPDAVDFITMEGVADTTELRATFGLPLTPLEVGLATYLKPK